MVLMVTNSQRYFLEPVGYLTSSREQTSMTGFEKKRKKLMQKLQKFSTTNEIINFDLLNENYLKFYSMFDRVARVPDYAHLRRELVNLRLIF